MKASLIMILIQIRWNNPVQKVNNLLFELPYHVFKSRLMLFSIFFLAFATTNMYAQKREKWMSVEHMDKIFKKESAEVEGEAGAWQMVYGGRLVFVLTDASNNRMRIFTPVVEEEKIKDGEIIKMLEANFHSALDAKYSLYEGFVISVFTHPLKELTSDQLVDAMQQVIILAETYGTTYSSTNLIFGGEQNEKQPKEKKGNIKRS